MINCRRENAKPVFVGNFFLAKLNRPQAPYLFDRDPETVVDVFDLDVLGPEDVPIVAENDTDELRKSQSEGRVIVRHM